MLDIKLKSYCVKIPNLEKGKYSVLIVEYATGYIFKKDQTLFVNNKDKENEAFLFFDDFIKAESYAKDFTLNNSKFECSIFDYVGKHISTIKS